MSRLKPVGSIKKVFIDKIVVQIFDADALNQNYKGENYNFKGINELIIVKDSIFQSSVYVVTSIYEDSKVFNKEDNYKLSNNIYLEAVNLGVLDGNNFKYGINRYPLVGDEVYFLNKDDIDSILECKDDMNISIGSLTLHDSYTPKLSLNKLFSNHVSILGNTGSGKSTTTRRILLETLDFIDKNTTYLDLENINIYIFDIHYEYQSLIDEYTNLIEHFDLKEVSIPLRLLTKSDWLNLLTPSVSAQLPILLTALKLSDLLDSGQLSQETIDKYCAYSLYNNESRDAVGKRAKILGYLKKYRKENHMLDEALKNFTKYGNFELTKYENSFNNQLEKHLDNNLDEVLEGSFSYEERLNELLDKAEHKCESIESLQKSIDYVIALEESKGNSQIRGYCSSLINRIDQLRASYSNNIFSKSGEKLKNYYKVMKTNEKVIKIIDVSSIDSEIILFITSFILGQIYEKKKRERQNKSMYNMVFDEAHTYICEEANHIYNPIDMFEKIAKEGRKFGIFMLMSSQRPSELSKTVLSQCNNFILHRIRNHLDLDQIRKSIPYVSEDQIKRLSYLETGVGLMTGEAFPIPYEVTVKGEGDNSLSKTIKPKISWVK